MTKVVGCRVTWIIISGAIGLGVLGAAYGGVNSIEDLDEGCVFSFSVMGDHKANDAYTNAKMKRMFEWQEDNDQFVIGMGDHANGQDEDPVDDMDQTRRVGQVAMMEKESLAHLMRVLIEMINSVSIE